MSRSGLASLTGRGLLEADIEVGLSLHSQMLHGAGIFTHIDPNHDPNVGKYSSTMEHLGLEHDDYP